ncbi:hypothetical protein [Enterobacter sichuanensis]
MFLEWRFPKPWKLGLGRHYHG